ATSSVSTIPDASLNPTRASLAHTDTCPISSACLAAAMPPMLLFPCRIACAQGLPATAVHRAGAAPESGMIGSGSPQRPGCAGRICVRV
ncbi:hypothetical protein, partial [Paracidovorax avenae]|uniref:hypothetical protein n=1 Tax=Paracidovorax avenae TaxID=80867 RepID=UPI001F34A199